MSGEKYKCPMHGLLSEIEPKLEPFNLTGVILICPHCFVAFVKQSCCELEEVE